MDSHVAMYFCMEEVEDDIYDILEDGRLYTLDILAKFRGEIIRSEPAFRKKLSNLFDWNIEFRDVRVTKKGGRQQFQTVMDKSNFLAFRNSPSYGCFEGDYDVLIKGFHINPLNDEGPVTVPDSPVKLASYADKVKTGSENELTITIRSGPEATDPPARGLTGFNILNDMNEMVKLLEHFNLLGQVTQVSKLTPGIPTLEIKLKDTLQNMVNQDIITKEPLMLYKPSPQSLAAGSTALYAHVRIDAGLLPRRILIEGVGGRVDMSELKHILSYHGEIMTDLQPQVWARDGPLKDIENGDIACSIKLKIELGFIIMNNNAFKVSYPGQAIQCSNCYGWTHRAGACDRREENRRDLLHEHLNKWKRQVNYQPMKDDNLTPTKDINQPPTSEERVENPSTEETLTNDPNNDQTLFHPTAIPSPILPAQTKSNVPTGNEKPPVTKNKPHDQPSFSAIPSNKALEAVTIGPDLHTLPTKNNSNDLPPPISPSTPIRGQEQSSTPLKPNITQDSASPKLNKNMFSTPTKILHDYKDTYEANEKLEDNDDGWITCNKGKRKSESPLSGAEKTTGSGKKKIKFAEKTKTAFLDDLKKIEAVTENKKTNIVKKEKAKKNIDILLESYEEKLFRNPDGKDPTAEEHWIEMKKAAGRVKSILTK